MAAPSADLPLRATRRTSPLPPYNPSVRAPLAIFVATLAAMLAIAAVAHARPKPPRWQTLPRPPAMSAPAASGHVEVDGARIYYATYGAAGSPVILLHGGMGNGDHWVHQVRALERSHQVIVIDSRGQGRSTRRAKTPKSSAPTYPQFAADVLAVMDHLALDKAAIVGWSDGGEVALELAIHHPDRVTQLVVYGATYSASGHKPRKRTTTFARYTARCRADHARLSATPKHFDALVRWLLPLWRTPYELTHEQLAAIHAPTLIIHGEHDEIVERSHVEDMARRIPNARLAILADTSHFALWQDPAAFNKLLVDFLSPAPAK